jgi:hypothetical protein
MAKKKISSKSTNKFAIEDEHRIRKAFVDKDWSEIKGENSWMIFKVMS